MTPRRPRSEYRVRDVTTLHDAWQRFDWKRNPRGGGIPTAAELDAGLIAIMRGGPLDGEWWMGLPVEAQSREGAAQTTDGKWWRVVYHRTDRMEGNMQVFEFAGCEPIDLRTKQQ